MTVVFSHETALERLRSVPPQIRLDPVTARPTPIAAASTDYKEAHALKPEAFGLIQAPLHVLVAPDAQKSRSPRIQAHKLSVGQLPARSLLCVGPSIYACGPELVFIELARDRDLACASCLGFELCGCYSHFAAPISGFYDRAPLTTPETIEQALDDMPGLYGRARVQAALARVCGGSRSPMETLTACELSFPASEGGFGLAKPQLNHRVDLDATARRLAGTSCCYVDIAWPEARTGIEYNGRDFHKDPARDRKRIEALEHMGWRIVTLEAADLGNPRQLAAVVEALGKRIPPAEGSVGAQTSPDAKKRAELHRDLLAATRCGLGLEGVLFGVPVARGAVPYHL